MSLRLLILEWLQSESRRMSASNTTQMEWIRPLKRKSMPFVASRPSAIARHVEGSEDDLASEPS